MSGPATASYSLADSGASLLAPLGAASGVWLAAQALREARQMGREYGEVLESVKAREAELADARAAQQQARFAHQAALRLEAAQHLARLERLRALAETLAEQVPDASAQLQARATPAPDPADATREDAWQAYLAAIKSETQRLESVFVSLRPRLEAAGTVALPDFKSPELADVLFAFARQRALSTRLTPEQAEPFRATAARILDRLELPAEAALPQELDALARAIILADSRERAEALASELRLAVQQHLKTEEARRKDSAEAQALLVALSGPFSDLLDAPLRLSLEAVAAGGMMFDPATRQAIGTLQAELAAARQRQEEEAAAWVLAQSLRDLGYDVEGVEKTLFVEGGVVHFQRQGWEGYFVRLRLNPLEKTLNFNVVRARDGDSSAERKRLDYLAEDRWCSEFPKLLETLKARGLNINVTRLLGAGELPVQNVDPASLPSFEREEGQRDHTAPLQRPL